MSKKLVIVRIQEFRTFPEIEESFDVQDHISYSQMKRSL